MNEEAAILGKTVHNKSTSVTKREFARTAVGEGEDGLNYEQLMIRQCERELPTEGVPKGLWAKHGCRSTPNLSVFRWIVVNPSTSPLRVTIVRTMPHTIERDRPKN